MLKQRTDQTTSQTKHNQNIDIDLQLNLLNVWMQSKVAGYYQNIVLAYLDQLQPKDADKFIQKEIKLTEQKKSPYFQLTKILTLRTQALQKLRSLVQLRQQDQILAKMPKICDKIKQLRECNLLTAEQILKMYQIYHCTQIEYTDKQMEYYVSILNSLHKDNQFIRKSPLNNQLKLSNDYDPFLMSPYEKIFRKQHQQIEPNVKELFSLNLSQVHRLIKVKKLVQELFSITKTKAKEKEQPILTPEEKKQPQTTPENKQILSHKRRYSRKSEDTQRTTHNEDDEIQLPRINNTPKNQENMKQPKRLMRSSIYNQKEKDRFASIQRDSKLKPEISRTNNQSLHSARHSKTEKKLKLQKGKLQNFKTQHYQKNKDIKENDSINIDADDHVAQKKHSADQIKEKIKMIGTKKLDLAQILKGRRLTPLKKDSFKESKTKDDQTQQQEIEEDTNVGLMTQVPLKRYNNKRKRQKDKLIFSHRYQNQLKKNLSAQKRQEQVDVQIQQQDQQEIPNQKNSVVQDKDHDSEKVIKAKNNRKDDLQQVTVKQKGNQSQNQQKKVAQNNNNTQRKGEKAQKLMQKKKASDKVASNKEPAKENQIKTENKKQIQSSNLKKPKRRQLVDRKEGQSIKPKLQNQPIKDKKSTNNPKSQDSQKILQQNKAQSSPKENQRIKNVNMAQEDQKQPQKKYTQYEKMKSSDDKLSNTSPKDYNRPTEKKKIAKANQVESQNKQMDEKIQDSKHQNEKINHLKNKQEDHNKQIIKEPLIKNDQKSVKAKLNQKQKDVQKQKIKQTQKIKQNQTNPSSQSGPKIVTQKKQPQRATHVIEDKQNQPPKQIQKKSSNNKEKEKEPIKTQTSKQIKKKPNTNKEKDTIKTQAPKPKDVMPAASKGENKDLSKQMPKQSTNGEQKNKQPSQTSINKQKQQKKIQPSKQIDKVPTENRQKQQRQSQLSKITPNNNQTQLRQKQAPKQLLKAQPQKQTMKKQTSQQALKTNKTSTDKQQQPAQNKQKPGVESKNSSKQPEETINKNKSSKQQIAKQQKSEQLKNPISKKQDVIKSQKQERPSNSKDVQKPTIQTKSQNLKEKKDNTEVAKKPLENKTNEKEPVKSPQKLQSQNPNSNGKPVSANKEQQKEPHQQNIENQQQLEPIRKSSNENMKQHKQAEEELPAVQNIIFQANDSFQEQQVPQQNEQESKPNEQPQQQRQQSHKNPSPVKDSQPQKQQDNQKNPQKAQQKSPSKEQQKNQQSKHQQKELKYKQIKMKRSQSSIEEITEILNKISLSQQHKPCFDLKTLISWIKVSQTYLTRFTIEEQDVLICLCSPVVNKALALMLWAPISPKINLDISCHLFKKYMELIQKYTTSSKVAFSGNPFKQLEAGQFIRKKENLYQRPRKNEPVIQQQEFQSFLYIECSNIKLQNKTNHKILYSQQIQSFKSQNCYCANFITQVNSQQIPSSLKSLLKYTPNVDNFAKVDQVLKQQKFDGYDAKNVQITNIDLIRFYLNSYLKTPFLAQDFYFKFFGYLLYEKGKECIVCVSLVKHHGFIYFAKNLPFPKILQIIKSSPINQKKQKFFNVMMFNKKLFGKMPNNPSCYGNWEINLVWEDQLQGNIKHDMNQGINFGPENFKVVIQLQKVVILGFQVSKND